MDLLLASRSPRIARQTVLLGCQSNDEIVAHWRFDDPHMQVH